MLDVDVLPLALRESDAMHELDAATLQKIEVFKATHPDDGAPRPRTLREWLERPELLVSPAPLVPFFAWRSRVTLLSARAKGGKSTIVGQAAAAVSNGEPFLNETTEPTAVLWYAIDEHPADTVHRLQTYGANLDNFFIEEKRPAASELSRDISATGAGLVVIDTLTELWAGRIDSDRDANDVARFIRPYVEVARRSDAALMLLHHTTKSGDQFRGSEQLAAAVDIVLTLRQPGQRPTGSMQASDVTDDNDFVAMDDGRRRIEGKGRSSIRIDLRIHFDGTHYHLGDGSLALDVRILRGLRNESMSRSALAESLRVRKERVLTTVHTMMEQGLIRVDGSLSKLSLTQAGLDRLN
jgi:hypothetical protein